MIADGLLGTIGQTALVCLPKLSQLLGREILVKMELLNPGGSVKDRAARAMVLDAERSGALKPGGIIVEGTAGNTGIGLAMVARARGHRVLIVMPDNQSAEKYEILAGLGAEVRTVPAVPFANQNHFYHTAQRVAAEVSGCWMNQFENPANWRTHYDTTGPEIWDACEGKLDALTMASGTGGTIGGTSKFLKEKLPAIKVVLADPSGSGLYEFVKHGVMKSEGSSVTEGIGIMRVTENFKVARIDDALRVSDQQMVDMAHWLLREEGMWVGSSSALNIAAAVETAKSLPRGSRIVTIACDGGARYQKRLFNDTWLVEKNLRPNLGYAPAA